MASWSHLLPIQSPRPGASSSGRGVLPKGGNMPTAEFTQGDLERLDDRLAHAEQYVKEALKALHECTELAAKIDEAVEEEKS
jgi:hypothetical protein